LAVGAKNRKRPTAARPAGSAQILIEITSTTRVSPLLHRPVQRPCLNPPRKSQGSTPHPAVTARSGGRTSHGPSPNPWRCGKSGTPRQPISPLRAAHLISSAHAPPHWRMRYHP
jgi:hypothetical protein